MRIAVCGWLGHVEVVTAAGFLQGGHIIVGSL